MLHAVLKNVSSFRFTGRVSGERYVMKRDVPVPVVEMLDFEGIAPPGKGVVKFSRDVSGFTSAIMSVKERKPISYRKLNPQNVRTVSEVPNIKVPDDVVELSVESYDKVTVADNEIGVDSINRRVDDIQSRLSQLSIDADLSNIDVNLDELDAEEVFDLSSDSEDQIELFSKKQNLRKLGKKIRRK